MNVYLKFVRIVCFGAGALLLGSFLSHQFDLITFALSYGSTATFYNVLLGDILAMAIVAFATILTSDVLPKRRFALTGLVVFVSAIAWQTGERSSFVNCSEMFQFFRPDNGSGCYSHTLWTVAAYLFMCWSLSAIILILIASGKWFRKRVK